MPQRTSLYSAHLAMGAKIVDFAGWEMPIHYGSQLIEHEQVRSAAGMFDVSHMTIVDITGSQAKAWLQMLTVLDANMLQAIGQDHLFESDGGFEAVGRAVGVQHQ